jgi:hypothetical protein
MSRDVGNLCRVTTQKSKDPTKLHGIVSLKSVVATVTVARTLCLSTVCSGILCFGLHLKNCLLLTHLKPSGHYMYYQFNIKKFYVLSTRCIYVFCVDLRTDSDYFPIQH